MQEEATPQRVLFVGGIHGVGKTVFCNALAKRMGVDHLSASDLILGIEREKSLPKQVVDLKSNQDLLIQVLKKHLKANQRYLLDGHFCLLDEQSCISKIPFQTFKDIAPRGILVLHDDVLDIQTRLRNRDNREYDLASLQSLQESELLHAEQVATSLNIPFLTSNPFTESREIENFIAKHFSEEGSK